MMEVQNKITALRNELHEHNRRYYIEDAPIISDYEFDQKLRELQELEAHVTFDQIHSRLL